MRGSKDYDKVTHGASKKGTKEKQKAVWDMIGAKKKLHDMVEALIGGDSKAAASALHDYLQQKTRAILGEFEGDMDLDLDDEEGLEGDEHEDMEGECPECHCDPCECESHEEHDLEHEDGEELGHEEHDFEEPVGEGSEGPAGSGGERGRAFSTDSSVKTSMKKLPKDAKDLEQHVKGKIAFKTYGKAKLTKPHDNAAPGLDRHVKGDIKFDTSGSAKLTHPHNNAAPGLDRKVKGKINFGK